MPQSLVCLYTHLVFSTKDRYPFLDDEIRSKVHAYIATLLRDCDASFVVVGGVADHVHVLFESSKLQRPVDVVEKLKKESSKFIKTLGSHYSKFYWQRGYGLFSVSPTHREAVVAYIENQEEHHRTKSFQEEYRVFLDKYGVSYDEKYVWG